MISTNNKYLSIKSLVANWASLLKAINSGTADLDKMAFIPLGRQDKSADC
jgi:hypothetical protein